MCFIITFLKFGTHFVHILSVVCERKKNNDTFSFEEKKIIIRLDIEDDIMKKFSLNVLERECDSVNHNYDEYILECFRKRSDFLMMVCSVMTQDVVGHLFMLMFCVLMITLAEHHFFVIVKLTVMMDTVLPSRRFKIFVITNRTPSCLFVLINMNISFYSVSFLSLRFVFYTEMGKMQRHCIFQVTYSIKC